MKRIGTGPNGEVLMEMSRDEAAVFENLRDAANGLGWNPGRTRAFTDDAPMETPLRAVLAWVTLKFNLNTLQCGLDEIRSAIGEKAP